MRYPSRYARFAVVRHCIVPIPASQMRAPMRNRPEMWHLASFTPGGQVLENKAGQTVQRPAKFAACAHAPGRPLKGEFCFNMRKAMWFALIAVIGFLISTQTALAEKTRTVRGKISNAQGNAGNITSTKVTLINTETKTRSDVSNKCQRLCFIFGYVAPASYAVYIQKGQLQNWFLDAVPVRLPTVLVH